MSIHSTAVISEKATLGQNIEVGPYTVIDDDVTVGDGCRIGPRVYLTGHTTIGANTNIHAGAVIGDEPQDIGWTGERSYTVIGKNCVLREYVTVHRGSGEGSTTEVGENTMLMAFAHVGHDCSIAREVVVANSTLVSGHVHIGDRAFLSGDVLVHQFVHIGTVAMIGGGSRIPQDVPPYCMAVGGNVRGVNSVGVKRSGLATENRRGIRKAIRLLYFNDLNRSEAVEQIRNSLKDCPEALALADFVENSRRGILPGMHRTDTLEKAPPAE